MPITRNIDRSNIAGRTAGAINTEDTIPYQSFAALRTFV
jgi:hypothetical protein